MRCAALKGPGPGSVCVALLCALLIPPPSVRAQDAAAIDAAARALPRLHSLLVSHHGQLILERYYNGARADRLANIKSASKSIVSTLVGIALERGAIKEIRTPLSTYFPELEHDREPRKRAITVEDLLTMRSGLESTSGRQYGAWVMSGNWVRHALMRPLLAPPGAEMEYSTGNSHLLSAVLTKATGMSTRQFANAVLAKPLGFTLAEWPRDPQGVYFGGNEMLLTPRQLLAIAELYLRKGRVGERQIVPESWVAKSCDGRPRSLPRWARDQEARGEVDPMRDRQYGYGWWVHTVGGHNTCFAWGYGGQYAFVFPSLDLVVVSTASTTVSDERRGHRRALFAILTDLIIRQVQGS